MAFWTEEERIKLIEIWSEDAIQAMLEGSRRNKEVFVKVSKEMANWILRGTELDFNRSKKNSSRKTVVHCVRRLRTSLKFFRSVLLHS